MTRPHAGRALAKATTAHKATTPGTVEFRASGCVAAALFLTNDTDRALTLLTNSAHMDAPTQAAALALFHHITAEENTP